MVISLIFLLTRINIILVALNVFDYIIAYKLNMIYSLVCHVKGAIFLNKNERNLN